MNPRKIYLDPNKSNVVQVNFKIDPWVHECLRRHADVRGVHICGLMRDILGAFVSTVSDFKNPDFWEPNWPALDLPRPSGFQGTALHCFRMRKPMGESPRNDVPQSPGLAGQGGTVTPVGLHTAAALDAANAPGKRQRRQGPTSSKGKNEIEREVRELKERAKNVTIQSRTKVIIRFSISMSCYRGLVELAEARGVRMAVVQQECMEAGIRKWKALPQRGIKLGMAFGDRLEEFTEENYGDKPADPVASTYGDFVRQEIKEKPEEFAGWLPNSPKVNDAQ